MKFIKHLYIKTGISYNVPIDKLIKNANTLEKINHHGCFPLLTLNNLSIATKVDYKTLHRIVSSRKSINFYQEIKIKKSNGDLRNIHAPIPELKYVQRWILENILDYVPINQNSYAYQKNKNTYDAISNHCGSKVAIKVDLKDFFNNISEKEVYKIFRDIGYPSLLSFELASICTVPSEIEKSYTREHDGKRLPYRECNSFRMLPQGAPTSGALANIVASKLDSEFQKFAQENVITYTRYADDLLFSSPISLSNSEIDAIISNIYKIIKKNNFLVNYRKTRVLSSRNRKIALGLVITDQGPKVPKSFTEKTRKQVRNSYIHTINRQFEKEGFRTPDSFINHIEGKLSYIKITNENKYLKLRLLWDVAKEEYYVTALNEF